MKWWPTVSTCVDLRNTALQKLPIKVLSGESLKKIPYLLELGINQIHLMPVYEFEQLGKICKLLGIRTGILFRSQKSLCGIRRSGVRIKRYGAGNATRPGLR